ncbi:hypothetical protein C5167_002923 [Papaver somniferum]|uniref:Phytocyanin domain-containing protein n=1 Tax=Papaver somniferum TaxID=3469 RepID=A0A4Y7KXB8_PAPSO|nr:mavicyanin-like [Papaver somniferum]RZC76721.1 hypothetical protein C5167_002923 [Papaver somniferum]
MGLVERVVFFMVLAALCVASSMAEVYKVGDDNGWTTQNMPDYQKWSASKAFKIGDSIVFEYSPKDNNVILVSYDDYKKCNGSSPMKTFTSGKDTIPIMRKEHLFFISGFPDSCIKGQKVDIRVADTSVAPTPPSAQGPSSSAPAPSPSVSVPAPSPNSAMSISKGITGKFGFVILAVVAAVAC